MVSPDLLILEKLKTLIQKEEVINEFLDVLNFNFIWLLRFCEKNSIDIPDKERLYRSLNKVRELLDIIAPPKTLHPKGTPDNDTVYYCVQCLAVGCLIWVSKNGYNY